MKTKKLMSWLGIISLIFLPVCKKTIEMEDLPTCMDRAVFTSPNQSNYILPFKVGKSYICSQSICYYGGGHRNQLSYDFDMPIGEEIHAARSGVVFHLKDDSPDNGQGNGEHNYILIEHDDGSVAFYAHLKQNGLQVETGEEVIAGQFIAYSGNSGLSSGPHLHFGVYQSRAIAEGFDLPVNFRNCANAPEGGLVMGQEYLALSY